jgi:hypothetical protein
LRFGNDLSAGADAIFVLNRVCLYASAHESAAKDVRGFCGIFPNPQSTLRIPKSGFAFSKDTIFRDRNFIAKIHKPVFWFSRSVCLLRNAAYAFLPENDRKY